MDVIIKDVPEEAVAAVKQMASVAVERHYRKDVVAPEVVKKTFEDAVDSFRDKNGLKKKFEVVEEEEPISKEKIL